MQAADRVRAVVDSLVEVRRELLRLRIVVADIAAPRTLVAEKQQHMLAARRAVDVAQRPEHRHRLVFAALREERVLQQRADMLPLRQVLRSEKMVDPLAVFAAHAVLVCA